MQLKHVRLHPAVLRLPELHEMGMVSKFVATWMCRTEPLVSEASSLQYFYLFLMPVNWKRLCFCAYAACKVNIYWLPMPMGEALSLSPSYHFSPGSEKIALMLVVSSSLSAC